MGVGVEMRAWVEAGIGLGEEAEVGFWSSSPPLVFGFFLGLSVCVWVRAWVGVRAWVRAWVMVEVGVGVEVEMRAWVEAGIGLGEEAEVGFWSSSPPLVFGFFLGLFVRHHTFRCIRCT